MANRKNNISNSILDSKQIREVLLSNGLFQTIDGEYIAASVIGRIIPNRTNGTAICKDKHGNRLAVLRWPQAIGGGHGE
jgi:hypothetical protein